MICTKDVQTRLNALQEFGIMDSPPEPVFDDIAVLASLICKTPVATVTLLDDRRQWFKARVGTETRESPIELAFCSHAIQSPGEMLIVTDARNDERFDTNPLVTDSPYIRFYAGAPMVTRSGVPIGTVCAIDYEPRILKRRQQNALSALARQAMALIQSPRLRSDVSANPESNELLQRSVGYFRHLTEYALDLVTVLEPDGTIRFESRSIERQLGYPPDQYRGRSVFEFVHPEDLQMVMEAFEKAVRQPGNTPVLRFRFLHKNGTYRYLEGTSNNLIANPAVRGIVFNSRDVTEHVLLEREVQAGRVEKEETIGLLTGGVAHDFNNILTSIQGHAELTAAKLPADSVEARYLVGIQAATARAAALTRQLLAFSRRVLLRPRSIAFDSWLEALGARLTTALPPGMELIVKAGSGRNACFDPEQIEHVVQQLVMNARDAMPGGGRITLEAAPTSYVPDDPPFSQSGIQGLYVKLIVTDEGSGMDDSTLARIFDPYFTTKTLGNHSGLGLPMCRGIIEQSGGQLTVKSERGRGTVFNLYFNAAEVVESQTPPSVPALAETRSPTILFVDDEPLLREIGDIMLSEAGFRVILAEDGKEALALLSEMAGAPPDLLLTDVIMPGMTGIQLAEQFCKQSPATRILLCSGYTRDAIALTGGLPPGVAFLPKPYSLAVLLQMVGELLAMPVSEA